MATTRLPQDLKEFLRLLNRNNVEYLFVGGYAVNWHGYVRATLDMDIWISLKKENIDNIRRTLTEFGFGLPEIYDDNIWEFGKIIRMGGVHHLELNFYQKHQVLISMNATQIGL